MAATKLILCASNQSVTVGVWSGVRLQVYETFENNEEGIEAFEVFIQRYQTAKYYVIADAYEEEYRLESLPHTSGTAKKELLERKLNQFNRNNLFRAAHFINQDKDKRRDDNYLFVALNNADFLQGWLDTLQRHNAAIVGLYLLPMISQYIVQQMKLNVPNILLCERLRSGLRQTYLSNGHVRISRMVPMTNIKPNQISYFYLTEIEKTRLYLLSQRFITEQTELQLVLPSLDSESEFIGKSISQEQEMQCKIVDFTAYAKNIDLAPDLIQQTPELLHMQLLANGNMPENLAPADYTKSNQLQNIKKGIHILTGIVILLGLFAVGYSLFKARLDIAEKESFIQQTAVQQRLYADVAKNFPKKPVSSQTLKQSVELATSVYDYNQRTPERMMLILSQALAKSPEVGIQRIRWVQSTNPDMPENANVKQHQSNGMLQTLAFVSAEILNFSGDYRAALESTNRLVANLTANPQVARVDVLQKPVNVSSLAKLKGSTQDESQSKRASAVFKLKIILNSEGTTNGGGS